MKNEQFKIKGKNHPAKFDMAVINKFCIDQGLESFTDFMLWYASVDWKKMPAVDIEKLIAIFKLGFERCIEDELPFAEDDIIEVLFFEEGVKLIRYFSSSLEIMGKQMALTMNKKPSKKAGHPKA